MIKTSKTLALFAAERLSRFPEPEKVKADDLTEEEKKEYLTYRTQKAEESQVVRSRKSYEKAKEEGRVKRKPAHGDMDQDALVREREIKRRAGRKFYYKKKYPDLSNEQLEEMVDTYMKENPRSAEGGGKLTSGPKRGCTMPRQPNPREGCKDKRKAEDLNEGPRPKGARSGTNYLELFFEKNPEVQRVERPSELPAETMRQYQRFRTNYNGRLRYHENPEAVQKKRRAERQENPDRFRATEARYKERVRTGVPLERKPVITQDWKKTLAYRWQMVKQSAEAKNLEVELSESDLAVMCVQPCYYCGQDPNEIEEKFGIDRVDNAVGYTVANSVTCCATCNFAKKNYHVKDFVQAMCNVGHNVTNDEERDPTYTLSYKFCHASANKRPRDFSSYRYSASTRNLDFNITIEQFDNVVNDPCYYCGRADFRMGLDRVDNSQGYDQSSCVASCSLCNYLKGPNDIDVFLCQAKMIYEKWSKKVESL